MNRRDYACKLLELLQAHDNASDQLKCIEKVLTAYKTNSHFKRTDKSDLSTANKK